ncbi:MAG TPA: ATP-binding protein [Thermoplasmata archaeon]|nr:ATP-binding protein [Thermoplasmata archaeon]
MSGPTQDHPIKIFQRVGAGFTRLGSSLLAPHALFRSLLILIKRGDEIMVFYVVIRGPLGVGKSTVAESLAKRIAAEHISIDRILDEHGLEEWDGGYISQKSFLRANARAIEQARVFLEQGTPVIFDGNFYWKSQIEDLLIQLDYRHFVFTLKAPLGVCIERDSGRKPPHGMEAARDVYAKVAEFDYGTLLDATRPVGSMVREIISQLPREHIP